jgi:hypothetical protein
VSFAYVCLDTQKTLASLVKSAVIGVETNILLNPERAKNNEVKELQRQVFRWDER